MAKAKTPKTNVRIATTMQVLDIYPFLSKNKLRYLLRNRKKNGLDKCIITLSGRNFYFDLDKFEDRLKKGFK